MSMSRTLACYALISGLVTGCASLQTQKKNDSAEPLNISGGTASGFRVFHGECLNTDADKISPLLLPLLTNVISGGITAIGTGLKAYGEDSDAKFASSLNFDKGEDVSGCLHVVYGKVFTDSADFQDPSVKLENLLPLPWLAIARANGGDGESSKDWVAALPQVLDDAKTKLASSGAMLAEKPRFFAEMKVIRSPDGAKVAFRLRAFYYGERLGKSWWPSSKAKAIVLTVSGFDASKSVIENLKNGYSVLQSDVPLGQAWVSSDLLAPNGKGDGRDAWDSPWYTLPPDKSTPTTLVAGLLETTAGSKLLSVLGTALEGSAETTAKQYVESIDPAKRATAEEAARTAENTARTNAAAAVVSAISDVNAAQAAYDTCIATPDSNFNAKRAAVVAFASARVTAAASVASAEPLFSQMGVPVAFLNDPKDCKVPK
ncbi:hypothetical protein V1687_28875 (plasmid) [Pseudomonas putida]|nr:hypothetical protein [Pseudomonas sp. FFUP_PS_41]QDQ70205.1 hypothetical protein pJBCL41_00419 [Pseudomonas sp.]WVM70366.1 hypothetical protein V1687_28875 [Pseudomonas putida]HDS0956931.1 hypothetical protein [Pseudomonas putida]